MTGGVLFQSVAEMATIWDLQFRFIYFSHTQWENGEIENVCKRTWETRIFLWKNSELIFSSSGGSCHLCLQTGHCKKHNVYAGASQTNFYETEFEHLQIYIRETKFAHLNIYKSIPVKRNLSGSERTPPAETSEDKMDGKKGRQVPESPASEHSLMIFRNKKKQTNSSHIIVRKSIFFSCITNPISPLQTIGQSMELELLP